ncbi:dihydrofolate reductase [Nitrosomonas ureae]|uniref:Dihydrofolate reductase n=1 Tax=Nitrosomonas ureae TaxID=44577 RepID=A0A285C2H3_9PROT|nr:dihydrofolate reductase [Nitrosomonas ureae]MBY0500057.1 dihydrofolate reductase [Nitrosomonas sp.]SNX61346.1 dihydrofolate reductase [Nitrosomonas ureae]
MISMRLSILVAMAKNRVIGQNNQLPWHLPADLKHFKFLTMGQTIVMGRKTYESIGRPLPGRENIIITRQSGYDVQGATVVNSLEDALLICEESSTINNESFIIGGEKLYRQTLDICQRMYITEIQSDFEGDVVFPEFDRNNWEEIQRDKHISDAQIEYHFVILERKV